MKRFSLFGPQQDPPNRVPDSWPPDLKRMHRAATSALKSLRRARQEPLSARESLERDDLQTLMEAMANPKKLVAVHCAMAEAMSATDGRALSDQDLTEADELSRAFEQEALTAEELEAVERLARKRNVERVG
jgi:hypothetical protein